jgi:hypothetical protein
MDVESKMNRFFFNLHNFLESKIREQEGATAINDLCKKDIDSMVMRARVSIEEMMQEIDAMNDYIKQKHFIEGKNAMIEELIDFIDAQVAIINKD